MSGSRRRFVVALDDAESALVFDDAPERAHVVIACPSERSAERIALTLNREFGYGERCYICSGAGRRSSFVLAVGRSIEGECPDCVGTGWLADLKPRTAREPSTGSPPDGWQWPGYGDC